MFKHKTNTKSGITLISLVVTIIVLLLLAGISIQMLTGDNGILQRAGEAKEKNDEAQIIEEVRLEIAGAQIEKNGNPLFKSELKDILKKYFKDVDQADIPNEITLSTNTELTTLNEKYTIKLSDIYSGKLATLSAGLYKAGTNELISPWTDIVGIGKCVKVLEDGMLTRSDFLIGDIRVKLVIDNSVKTIGNMSGIQQLEEVIVPDTVTSIGNGGFAGCTNLKSIEIPDSITSIEGSAFAACSSLESIYIPNGIKAFDNGLFYNCPGLVDIYYDGGKDEWAGILIGGGNDVLYANTTTIHYLRQKYEENYWDRIYVGATIVGYDPSIAPDGSTINTSYTSLGSYNNGTTGTYGDGTTGNGETNTTFAVSSIKTWQVLGIDEENKQILITTAGTPVATNGGVSNAKLMPFRGQSGYAIYNNELNKICAIYGQGKYADTSKHNIQLNTSSISTGGRSISIEDLKNIGYETVASDEKTFTKNESDGLIYYGDIKTNSTEFNYWGEDAIPSEGIVWKKLENGQSVNLNISRSANTPFICNDRFVSNEAKNMIHFLNTSLDTNLQNWGYWISCRFLDWDVSNKRARYKVIQSGFQENILCYSNGGVGSNGCGVRPAVYLKANLKLSYNPTTQAFAIESE